MPVLSHTIDLKNDMSNWNASVPKRIDADEKRLKINIPKGGYASRGGVNVKCKPDGIKKSRSFELSFKLRVRKNHDWVKGGKLGLGANINRGTGGKSWKKNDGSCRLMWRRDGQLIAYLYLCEDQGSYRPGDASCPLVTNQGDEFKDACGNRWPESGLDVFRHTKHKLFLKKGAWNRITYGATLNSAPDKSDGKLWVELNGERLETAGIRFTKNVDKNQFSQIQLPIWFGGGDASWAPKKDTWFKLKDMTYTFS